MKRLPHISFALISLALIILLYSATRGLTYHDEGYIINSAYRVLQGEVPYRDFHFAYTPLTIFTTSLFFVFGNVSIITERFAAITISVVSMSGLYYLAKKTIKDVWFRMFVVLGFVVWGPLHINFVWPVMMAISSTLIMMCCVFLAKEKHNLWFLTIAGTCAVLAFLSKQNFGLASFFTLIVVLYMVKPSSPRHIFLYLFPGIFVSIFFFLCYLLFTNSYMPFIKDFISYTIQRIIISNSLTTPFIYPSSFVIMITKTCVYMIPLITSVISIVMRQSNSYIRSIGAFTLFFYLLGIRPTTDYIHLVPLLAITSLPFGIIADRLLIKKIGLLIVCIFTITGFIRGVYANYYKWEAPLYQQHTLLTIPSGDIYTSNKSYAEVTELSEYVRSRHIPTLFIYEYAPLFYVLSQVRNPTPYDLIDQSEFYKPYQQEILDILAKKRVNTIITGYSVLDDNSEITRYITQSYSIHKVLYDHIVWMK